MRTIAHLTDLHLDDPMALRHGIDTRSHFLQVLSDLRRRGIREVEITGDMAESSAAGWLFSRLEEYDLHATLILGNHDDPDAYRSHPSMKTHFHDDLCYHAMESDGFLHLHLDSHAGTLGTRQLAWLDQQVSSTALPLLLFIHHPILDCGNTPMDRRYPLHDREEARACLLRHGNPTSILCGHYHAVHCIVEATLTQMVTPSTYAQLKTTGDLLEMEGTGFGYRLLTLGEGRLETTLIRF